MHELEMREARSMEEKMEVELKCEEGGIKAGERWWEKHPRGCRTVMKSI